MACFLGQSEPLDGKRQPTQLFFELRPLRPYYICTSFLSSSSHDTTNCITTTQLCQQLLLAIVAKHNSAPSHFSLFCISQASHPHHAGYYIRRNLFKQIYLQVLTSRDTLHISTRYVVTRQLCRLDWCPASLRPKYLYLISKQISVFSFNQPLLAFQLRGR